MEIFREYVLRTYLICKNSIYLRDLNSIVTSLYVVTLSQGCLGHDDFTNYKSKESRLENSNKRVFEKKDLPFKILKISGQT